MALFMLSQVIGAKIVDSYHEKVATLKDVIVRINPEMGTTEEKYPPLAGLLAHSNGREFWIPASQVLRFDEQSIELNSTTVDLQRFTCRDGEILLGRNVLDKQLVDIEGRRVIRVNDLALGQTSSENQARLLGVDISFRALSRRLLPRVFPGKKQLQRREKLIDWADVQYFAANASAVHLHVSHDRLAKLHPADLVRVLDDLSHQQRDEVMEALPDETVADALEMMMPNEAADILEEIEEERASDILEEMRPDAAADVVADMEDEKAQLLLNLMEGEESEEVRELLAYPEDTAGGLMTNEFLFLPAHLGAAEALRLIRAEADPPEFADYIYVHEPGTERFLGAVSLREVVFCSDRSTPLERLMERDIISVHPTTSAREAAALLTEYGLRALPVVEENGDLVGIITFDDALDILLPDDLRERVAHIFTYRRGRSARQVLQAS